MKKRCRPYQCLSDISMQFGSSRHLRAYIRQTRVVSVNHSKKKTLIGARMFCLLINPSTEEEYSFKHGPSLE